MTATRRSRRFLPTALAAGAATALVLLSGCSSSSDGGSSGDSSDAGGSTAAREVAGDAPAADTAADPAAGPAVAQDGVGGAVDAVDSSTPGVEAPKVISTGNVQLRSDDVGKAIFDVRTVV